MTHALDLRPGDLDLVGRPGNALFIRLTWPEGLLEDRSFVAFMGDDALAVEIDGDVMNVTASKVVTAEHPTPIAWVLAETDGDVVITGRWLPSLRGTSSPVVERTVVLGNPSVTVNVAVVGGTGGGGGGGAVDSVNGQTGTVVLTAANVGADPAGAAATVADDLVDHAALTTLAHGGLVASTDIRLTDPRPPTAHHLTHQQGGTDEISLAQAQVIGLVAALAAKATPADITTAINNLVGGAPGLLDTLKEIADALGDDPNFAATIATALASKQPLDTDLTAIAALTTTSYGRAFLVLADAAAGRTALGLGTAATQASTAFDAAGAAAAAQAAAIAAAVQRANHTGTQAIATVVGLQAALDGKETLGAAAALLTGTITNGDATHAPTGDAVFDALALKANTASLGTAAAADTGTSAGNVPTVAQGDARWAILEATTAIKTAAYTATDGELVRLSTAGGGFASLLPNTPRDGWTAEYKWDAGTVAPTLGTQGSDTFKGGGVSASFSALTQVISVTYRAAEHLYVVKTSISKSGLDSLYPLITSQGDLAPVWPQAGIHVQNRVGAAGQALTADRAYYVPITLQRACTVSGIDIAVQAAVTSAVARLGLYASTTDGRPGALLQDGGTVAAATTGVKSATFTGIPLAAGLYWIAVLGVTVAPTLYGLAANSQGLGQRGTIADNLARNSGYSAVVAVTGTLDSPAPSMSIGGTLIPNAGLSIASVP